MPLFTVFVPTYNRGDILCRTLDSVAEQEEADLEIIIIDDGSSDDTKEKVDRWVEAHTIALKYIYQSNQGKTAAHNTMLEHATGELTVLLNSDDLLAKGALATVRQAWEQARSNPDCGGIEGLSADLESGELLGTKYPQDKMLSNYLDMRQRFGVKGDKLNVIKTSVLKAFPFPRFPGEKHVPPSTVWSRIAHHYDFVHLNTVLQLKEYRDDGITKAWSDKKSRNPCGYRQFYLEILNDHKAFYSFRKRLAFAKRYVYLSLLCGVSFKRLVSDMDRPYLYLIAFPIGAFKYLIGKQST